GSLGIDLAEAVDITLKDQTVHKIPTGVVGPVLHEKSYVGALLVGRSSAGIAGLIVLPGVIDADYTGEILVCAYTLSPPLTIPAETQIAQLVLLPKVLLDPNQSRPYRKECSFGSSGDTVVSLVQQMQKRPMVTVVLSSSTKSNQIQVMMDTGADVTIIN
ncbi:POK9 protein, partial [Alectura lathami]|nr:POK9 protein [Alectura lathami]